MVDQAQASYRERLRDPGVMLWAVAAVCWAALLVPILVGGLGGHDHLLGDSTLPVPAALLVFAGSWLVMIGAMMLPTTVPMVRLFTVVSARQPRPAAARAAFLAGYLALWMAFALVALAAATGIQAVVARWPWLDARPQWVLAGVLAIAGAFQFSPLKQRCLTQCRDPKAFLYLHYRRGARGGWALGLRHGLSCLGCCWALMLVMFGAGVGNLLVMVVLTAVMVAEKNTRWGKWIAAPVGVVLLFAAAAVALDGIGAPATGGHEHMQVR
ncbi:DUF2182 domain-containing protein [Pseudonocardia asaccharolytica]|uniref:Metal-binding protein n=1 Tax=Pseudonocardia asaccharolytica DSM 44247 = NBRC 16224 TaxID=1123024 RepID=A0A511D1H4_9PSEU|nr:DUF2182 domain-containing protein [Pseudonocardia asaccharolytica]GEL17394.1 hypothetical protein PA7_12310 [Pseudonocardia asaccharolytica DSM 44247 = NBRC 16224]